MVKLFHKPIVLLGFMGSGKSTLGKQIAPLLDCIFVDLDRFIETEENRTIPDIFRKEGEATFRKLETIALRNVLVHPNQIIAIGGGAPCNAANLQLIKEKAISIYLKVSETELLKRLSASAVSRPLLSGQSDKDLKTTIEQLMAAREPYYLQADFILESDCITPEMIVEKLKSIS